MGECQECPIKVEPLTGDLLWRYARESGLAGRCHATRVEQVWTLLDSLCGGERLDRCAWLPLSVAVVPSEDGGDRERLRRLACELVDEGFSIAICGDGTVTVHRTPVPAVRRPDGSLAVVSPGERRLVSVEEALERAKEAIRKSDGDCVSLSV